MKTEELNARLADALRAHRRRDGGFPVSAGGDSEVEPTVVAALALRDDGIRAWLAARQRADGGFDEIDGRATQPPSAALAALALDGRRARRALAYVVGQGGRLIPGDNGPHNHMGWGWASNPDDARTFVEPTARALLAVKARTPDDTASRAAGVRMLGRLQCADGGWNYGTVNVNSVDLRGYAQTTAVALMALQGDTGPVAMSGLQFLRKSWRREPGGLTTAQALVAFRLHGVEDEVGPVVERLGAMADDASFRGRPLTLAWGALATGPDELLDPLRSRV